MSYTDIDLNKGYMDFEMAKAEICFRGDNDKVLTIAMTIFAIVLFLAFTSPMLLVFFGDRIHPKQETVPVVVAHKAPPMGGVSEEEASIDPMNSYDTIHYSLSEMSRAAYTAEMHQTSIVYVHDTQGNIVGYDVTYPIQIVQKDTEDN